MSSPGGRRFLISIHHPAQAHFFRYVVAELRSRGHEVRVCVRDKEMTAALLDAFDIDHTVLARSRDSLAGTALAQSGYELRLLRAARRFRPDVMTSIGGIEISHVAPLVGARSIAFTDTPTGVGRMLTAPSIDVTCTPTAFEGRVRGEHREYEGFHELAYLHPDRFTPRRDRLRAHGIDPDERLAVLRFVDWQAFHDVGKTGFSRSAKQELIATLDEAGSVYVTAEGPLPVDFADHALPIPPSLIHDLLAVADLYVGDSATMATEAAVLGTPAVRSSANVAGRDLGNFVELEQRYGLVYSFVDDRQAVATATRLFAAEDAAAAWRHRRDRLLSDTIDVTAYAVDQLESLAREGRSRPATHQVTEV